MGLFMMALLIISGALAGIYEYIKDIKKKYDAQNNGYKTYRDHNGNLRNSYNGHYVYVEDGREIDGITKEIIFNPYKNEEEKEIETCKKLGWRVCKVFNTDFEQTINSIDGFHKNIYRKIDEYYNKSATPYGKLNCNLGYQFWVNLKTGIMEETELSKSINHLEVKKYHKKLIDNRQRKIDKYTEDYTRPYTREELEGENEKILQHLKNHNHNVRTRSNIPTHQKFAPNWCYNPNEKQDVYSYLNDNLIYEYEWKARRSVESEKEEGYYD